MSGGDYVESFGNRMKHYPKRALRKPQQKTGQWYRTKNLKTHWIYFFYTAHLADLADFERGIVGSFHRRSEPLGLIRPHTICHMPYATHRGVDLFMESL